LREVKPLMLKHLLRMPVARRARLRARRKRSLKRKRRRKKRRPKMRMMILMLSQLRSHAAAASVSALTNSQRKLHAVVASQLNVVLLLLEFSPFLSPLSYSHGTSSSS